MPTARFQNTVNKDTTAHYISWKNVNKNKSSASLLPKSKGPSPKWVAKSPELKEKRLEEEDEDTTDVSASSRTQSLAGDEEVPWSCPSEEEESLGRTDVRCDSDEDNRNGGQVLLALLQGPSTPKSQPAPAPDAKPGRTKLTTCAALFVPRGTTSPPGPAEPCMTPCMPTIPASAGNPKSGFGSFDGFIPARVSDGHSAVRLAVEEAFPGQPWGICVSSDIMPESGCIEVEVALRVPPKMFDEVAEAGLGILQSHLIAQGSQIQVQSTNASLSMITFTFSDVPSDQCCWEWVHYGHCPRPNCRWPHACPVPYCVRLSVHSMGEGLENSEAPPSMPQLMQDRPSSQLGEMMPAFGLPAQVSLIVPATGPTTPRSSVADTMPAEEAQANGATQENSTEAADLKAQPGEQEDSVVILSTAVDDEVKMYEDIEVAFGTVEDENEDDWAISLGSPSTAPNVEALAVSEISENPEKVVSKTKWADLPDDDDGLPSGPLWPMPRSTPASPMQEQQPEPEIGARGKAYPSSSFKPRSPKKMKSRLQNRTLQWKAKT